MDIQAANDVEYQSGKKGNEEPVGQEECPWQPETQNYECPQKEFQPGKNDGCQIDEIVRQNLIIINHLGECRRLIYLVQAGGDKYAA